MKKLITELHVLTAPKEKEELIICLAAAKEAISIVLMTERDGKQMPIYFVSRALQGLEINYTPMEKLILALNLKGKREGSFPKDYVAFQPIEGKHELFRGWLQELDFSMEFQERFGYVNPPLVKRPWRCDGGQVLLRVPWHGAVNLVRDCLCLLHGSLHCSGRRVLKVGMPIPTGITASVPYVNENDVSLLLDLIIKCTKKSKFQWTAEAKMAFKRMKKLITELHVLTAPKEKEELIICLAAAKEAISIVLMTERDGKQMPIYFVSRALQGLEINYTPMEKLILALVTGRPLKWSFKLREHDIHYRSRTSVKGQILTDFIVERSEDDSPDTPMEDKEELPDPWISFTDESSCIDGSGAGLILTNPEGAKFTYALRFWFNTTNNEAEYEALIAGLRIAEQMGVKNLQANVDSRHVRTLTSTFKELSIKQVPRGENKKVDALSKMASTSFAHLSKQVLVEELKEKSIDKKEVLAVIEEEGRTWISLIHEYLTEEILPEERGRQEPYAARQVDMS
nr:reverse transcriptase domain-containing protein [Tanacetum cinerariifolium]